MEVPVVESVTVNKQNDSMKGTSVFDPDLVKAYLKDVESKTRLKVHKIQVEFLKESLRNNKFEKL
ncbi:HNH endonuclease, partial [Priestia megaterium]